MGNEKVKVKGKIIKDKRNLKFDVEIPVGETHKIVEGYLSGKLRMHKIKIVAGDKVIIELSPYDLNKGRIIERLN
jgi:translation initiation factor IF-1